MFSRRMLTRALAGIFGLLLTANIAWGATNATLLRVESNKVCMVNDRLFPNEQIPVKVNGKMYYGCCSNCKKTLTESSEARTGVDPFSGLQVDKAEAVIAAFGDGRVLYFQNQGNLDAYKVETK